MSDKYEITHCHANPEIAYVKRSPHECVGYGEYKCVGVQDEIAMISLSRHESEMAEIVRRSNAHDELVAALEGLICFGCQNRIGWTPEEKEESDYGKICKVSGCVPARAALQKARGGTS